MNHMSKHKYRTCLMVGVIALLLLFAVFGARAAGAAGFTIPWWTVDAGGGQSSGGSYAVSGTIGQPDSGSTAGGQYAVNGGFWTPFGEFSPPEKVIYLPVVVR
jgi:hypothetical protein